MKTSNPTRQSDQYASETKSLLLLTDIVMFLTLFVAAVCFGPRNSVWLCGLGISVLSFAFWMVARRQLGKSFMIAAAAKELVTTGLYRRFRHPIYLFGGLATLGSLVALQIWWLVVIWLAYSIPIQTIRLWKEDGALEAKFGEEFIQLRSQAWI